MRASLFRFLLYTLLLPTRFSLASAPPSTLQTDQLTQDLIATVDLSEPPSKTFDFAKFQELVKQGADVNGRNRAGQPVIYLAVIDHAYKGDSDPQKPLFLQATKILLDKGANVNATDRLGITALMHEVHRAHSGALDGSHPVPDIKPMYDLLLSATSPSPDLNAQNVFGETALYYLAKWGEIDMAQRFINLGANIYTLDTDGQNLLFGATAGQGTDLLTKILGLVPAEKRSSMVNQKNNSGTTALMAAVRNGNASAVSYLLKNYPVEVNAANVEDETSLSLAQTLASAPRTTPKDQSNFLAIADILKENGAKVATVPDPADLNCKGPNQEPFGFEKVNTLIHTCSGIDSLDKLIPLFPKSLLSNYVLGYDTRGIQQGSASHPRVVTLGRNGRSILAFTGDPTLGGFNTLEVIDFKTADKDGKGYKPHFDFHEISFANGQAAPSDTNPEKCLSCHGQQDPHPLWDTWYLWPGFYNSEQGALYPTEKARYAEYLKFRKAGRYANLLEPSDSFWSDELGIFNYVNTLKNSKTDGLIEGMNSSLIIGQLINNPGLTKYKYAVLGGLSCQNPITEFLPANLQLPYQRSYDDILKETKALDFEEFQARVKRQGTILGTGEPEGNYSLGFVTRLRYIIEGLGFSMDWSTAFSTHNTYVMFNTLVVLEEKLWSHWLNPSDSDEGPVYSLYKSQFEKQSANQINLSGLFSGSDYQPQLTGVDNSMVCKKLVDLSLKSLGATKLN